MYHLIVSAEGKPERTTGPVSATEALRDWSAEEATGYQVTCQDEDSNPVTKAGLRAVARYAGGA